MFRQSLPAVPPLLAALFVLSLPAPAVADEPPLTVAGTVLGAAGDPVSGAEVGELTPDGPQYSVRTGADGAFSLPIERYEGRPAWPQLIARGPGGELAAGPRNPNAEGFPATLTLGPPRVLTVTVRRENGDAAPGVPVYAVAGGRVIAFAVSDPGGTARLAVPAGVELDAVVAVQPGAGFGYALPDGEDEDDDPDRFAVRLGGVFSHRVRCVAVDPITGETRPAAGTTVRPDDVSQPWESGAVRLWGYGFAVATADADGVAALDWLPTDAPGPVLLFVDGEGLSQERAYVDPSAPAAEQTVTLRAAATLFGRVTHADGSPAAGVTLKGRGTYFVADGPFTRANTRDLTLTAVTGADGRFETSVRGDTAYLILALPEGETAAAEPAGRDGALVPAPGERLEVNFALSAGTPITGLVTRGEGADAEPLAGQHVGLMAYGEPPRALRPPTYPWGLGELAFARSVRTDAAGRYLFRVGPGWYQPYVSGASVTERIAVAAGDGPVTRDFALPRPEELTVAGVVTDDVGLTLPGVTVSVTEYRGATSGGPGGLQTVVTDADGAFSLARTFEAPPERRQLHLSVTAVDDLRGPLHGWIDHSPDLRAGLVGPTTGLTLVAHRQTALTGFAVDAAGAPLAGVRLNARPADVNKWKNDGDPLNPGCVTGPNGRFLFRGVFVGRPTKIYYTHEMPNGAATMTVSSTVGEVSPAAGAVDRVGLQKGLRSGSRATLPPLADRAAAVFETPDGPAAALKAAHADAALLGRNLLVLAADPATGPGRALFALLYDDRAVGRAADDGFLTRCLPPADGAAGPTLTAYSPDGAVLGTLAPAAGDRAGLLDFLAAHRPAAD